MGRLLSFIKRLADRSGADGPLTATVAQGSAARGRWGEGVAARHLMGLGWRIVGRNERPCRKDRRCEIDIIAFDPEECRVIFVEVKTHKAHSDFAGRLWRIDSRKKRNLLRASANWLIRRHWHGNFRFDVIEVYGEENGPPPVIDHIPNVRLFSEKWRWW